MQKLVGRFLRRPCQFAISKTAGAVVGSDQLGQRMFSKGTTLGIAEASLSRGEPWKPVEILAMILGFIVYWPIGLAGVVTSLKEKHENSASRMFSNYRDYLAPHVHSRRAKGLVGPCRSEMTLNVESVVGGCVS